MNLKICRNDIYDLDVDSLTSAFEKGGALEDIELLPNIAEMMKYDGKTYNFMPSFDFETYVVVC